MSILDKTEIIGGLLKRIGNYKAKLYLKNFDDRLIFQKTIYLLQAFGLYIGIRFSWYIHGPYSTILARYGYELAKFEETCPIIFESKKSEKRFNLFVDFLGSRKNDAKWLEALASIHFLKNTYHNLSRIQIISMVIKKQPYLTVGECQEAWNYLLRYDLIKGRD